MQTTLLGIAIAFILALLAALIGPHFVDWSRFRPQFEAEATRVIGLPVRVEGTIDARLLPTPSLRLRGVSVGARFDESTAKVAQLDVEFNLGSLMRGEWRADELTLNGLAVDLGLDDSGHMEWAARSNMFNVGALTVNRLNITGMLTLKGAASRSLVTFDNVAFQGDVRTGAGVVRGDGTFVAQGTQYPFHLSTAHPQDGNGLHLHLAIDPGARAVAADLDGIVLFDDAVPRFDGAVVVNTPAVAKSGDASAHETPWKIGAKLKADPSAARFDQLELSYGAEDTALKLGGSADLRLGTSPLFHAVLTARQLDADRALARPNAPAPSPLELARSIGNWIGAVPTPSIPVQLEITSDLVMLGGRPIQNIDADLRSSGRDWSIDHLEFRAPGETAVTLSGRIADLNGSPDFGGPATFDIGDPDGLMLWLRGESNAQYVARKPMRAQGRLSVNKGRIAVDSLAMNVDDHAIGGSVALVTSDGKSSLDASLTADAIDLKSFSAFSPGLSNLPALLPQAMRLALDVGSVTAFGETLKPVKLQLDYGPDAITIDRLRIGSADGVMVEGNGAFDRSSASGQLNLSTSSASLDQIAKLVQPVYPKLGERIGALPTGAGDVWLGLSLFLDKAGGDRANLHATLDLDSPVIKGSINAAVSPPVAALNALDAQAVIKNPLTVNAKLSADHGDALLRGLGLDGVLAADGAPATLDTTASGTWQKPLTVKASLGGRDLDVTANGTVDPWNAEPTASLDVLVRKANIAPLARLGGSGRAVPAAAASHVDVAGTTLTLSGLDTTFGSSRLRGRLEVKLGGQPTINGELGADTIDVPATIAVAIGAVDTDKTAPFGKSLLQGWRGHVAFQALRAVVPGGEIRPLSGAIEADGTAVTLQGLTGAFAGGQGKADFAARRDADGVAITGHIQLAGADGLKLRYRGLSMPEGKISAELGIAAEGRSEAALIGAISGSGSVTYENGRISGFDPKVFQAATDAFDAGKATDETHIKALVEPLLANGTITVGSADFPVTLKDGQLRVGKTTLTADRVRLAVSGGYDLAADQFGVQAELAPLSVENFGGARPAIEVLSFGTPDAPARSIDVSALSTWLTLRAVDRQTRQLDAIEHGTPANRTPAPAQPAAPSPPSPSLTTSSSNAALPPLPPPVQVKPAPVPVQRPPAPPSRPPLVLTPGGDRYGQ